MLHRREIFMQNKHNNLKYTHLLPARMLTSYIRFAFIRFGSDSCTQSEANEQLILCFISLAPILAKKGSPLGANLFLTLIAKLLFWFRPHSKNIRFFPSTLVL